MKVVVVTGASSGIGLATSKAFAAKGDCVVLASRDLHKLQNTVASLGNTYGKEAVLDGHSVPRFLAVKTDVVREEDCKNLIETTADTYGRIDVLVNNAGVSMRALFKDLELDVIKHLMDVNFWGTVFCSKHALPYLLATKGSVVGVISIAGYKGLPARTGYSASKFAIYGFLDTLRVEHLKERLHVMIFAPGFTASNIRFRALTADGTPQGETPRNEEKMMSADTVARHLVNGVYKRKREVILTPIGKLTVMLNKLFPSLVDRLEYRFMKNEPNSPLK